MEKIQQPQVLILGGAPKPSILERIVGATGLVGGGLLGTYYGLKMYGSGANIGIDVTKPGSWEAQADQARAESVVAEELERASGKNIPKVGTVARAEMDANAELEKFLRRDNPNATLGTVEGPKHTTDVNPLGVTDTPYKEASAPPAPGKGGKAAPRVVTVKQAKQLIALATADTAEVTGVEAITYHLKNNILSAKLHLADGPAIHIPQIDPVRVGLGSNFMSEGVRHVTNPQEVSLGVMQIIPNALSRRELALAEDTGLFKATWGALKKMDGAAKFNIAGMALMGVVLGGVVADVAKSIVHGVTHMGKAAPEPKQHL